MSKDFLFPASSPRHRAAMRLYTSRVIVIIGLITLTLTLLAATACTNPAEPTHDIVVTCSPLYLPVLTPTDTLWHKTTETRCTWLDTTTGQGGAGRGPTS